MEQQILKGTVEDIIYSNGENGYTICVFDCGGEPVTAVGYMPFLAEGESISIQGEWTVHPTFGRQFKVEFFEKDDSSGSEDILRYLSSGAVKGIGPITAQRIVDRFGDDTANVLENNWKYLSEIRGISPKRANEIHDEFTKQFGLRRIMMYFGRYFGAALSVKIFKRYGSGAVELVSTDPYRLCREINGIGFERADRMAKEVGISPDAPERIAAYLHHALYISATSAGHCYVDGLELVDQAARALSAAPVTVAEVLQKQTFDRELICVTKDGADRIYLPEYYRAECYVAQKLCDIAGATLPLHLTGIDGTIDSLEKEFLLTYDDEQRRAIACAITNGLTIVTGGPGTGKTTVIKAIIALFSQLKFSFLLAAPTGRAAKRMSEASGKEAKTIHRLLEWGYSDDSEPKFRKNDTDPLACGALIIDETSMVDILLMEALLKAVKPGTFLILIGDVDQLPPVGAGNCLSDIISSGRFPVCRLKKIFRQAEQSHIVVNAHRINSGEQPLLDVRDSDFFFLPERDAISARNTIISLCETRLPKRYGLDPLLDIQVISPTHKGELGTDELNKALQAALNPPFPRVKRERSRAGTVFREGDKVMQTRNDYDVTWTRDGGEGTGIFNGDIGMITKIDPPSGTITINFDERIAVYDSMMLDELDLAYAITVHKGQGSEYRFVVIPAFDCPRRLMTRSLLYTAVTRAREMVIIVGKRECIAYMTNNDQRPNRNTALGELLCRDG